MTVLEAAVWGELAREHVARADELTAGHRDRASRGQPDPVEDFLFTYYATKPSLLRRWHPGAGVTLNPSADGPTPHTDWRWYVTAGDGSVALDVAAYQTARGDTVEFVHRLLVAIASRPPLTGCFGLHEWAMVYRSGDQRHGLPLRLGAAGTDAVVESHQLRCTHFDAFRFFAPEAVSLNRVPLARDTQVAMEQPGCLHAAMDCHRWSLKLGPVVPGDLALDCFTLAADARRVDMRASPYDLSAQGHEPIAIETAAGKLDYVERQRLLAQRAAVLRQRLIEVCTPLLAPSGTPS